MVAKGAGFTAQCPAFDRFQKKACGVCDPVVSNRTIFGEHLHQSICQGDLVGRLSAIFFGNTFERASKEVTMATFPLYLLSAFVLENPDEMPKALHRWPFRDPRIRLLPTTQSNGLSAEPNPCHPLSPIVAWVAITAVRNGARAVPPALEFQRRPVGDHRASGPDTVRRAAWHPFNQTGAMTSSGRLEVLGSHP
ncbi:MAG: hypothetical protein OXI66_09875, partial [Boseongicola sp.]|nr:hypothetical protein [Boseongicola sp.]